MITIEVTEEEAKTLWNACNQAQHAGLTHHSQLIKTLGGVVPESWLDECLEEYGHLQSVKEQVRK